MSVTKAVKGGAGGGGYDGVGEDGWVQSASPPLDVAPDEQPPPRRAGHTGRDMTISLMVLLIPLALVVAVFRLRGGEDTVIVDPSQAIASARSAALFPVDAPHGLGNGWRPLSAQFTRKGSTTGELRVGYLTPTDGQLQLIESNEDAASLSSREFGDGARLTATTTVAGAPWQVYEVRVDEKALVLTTPQRTLIVIGHADSTELAALATAVS
jgi:hypothetical protein